MCEAQFRSEGEIHYNRAKTCEKEGMSDATRQIGMENSTKTFVHV